MYYVYLLKDPRNNLPFYVGKGQKDRALWHLKVVKLGKPSGNPYKDHVIKQILTEGFEPLVEIVYQTDCEEEAYDLEAGLIKQYGRRRYDTDGLLTNLCEDSRPPKGPYTSERREAYRQRMLGNQLNKNRVQSDEEKLKRAQSLKNAYASGRRVVTDKMRETSSNTHKGKIVSKETRQKIAERAQISGVQRRGKSWVELFGPERAAEIKSKLTNRLPANSKPVTIDGVTYDSIKHASRVLNISEYKVIKLVKSKEK